MTVARHVDTGQIREWGPLLSSNSQKIKIIRLSLSDIKTNTVHNIML